MVVQSIPVAQYIVTSADQARGFSIVPLYQPGLRVRTLSGANLSREGCYIFFTIGDENSEDTALLSGGFNITQGTVVWEGDLTLKNYVNMRVYDVQQNDILKMRVLAEVGEP